MRKHLIVIVLFLTRLIMPAPGYCEQHAALSPDITSLEQLMNTEVTTVIGASKYQQELRMRLPQFPSLQPMTSAKAATAQWPKY